MRIIKANFAPLGTTLLTLAMAGALGFQIATGLVPPAL